jgi:hypothetical protein
MIAQKNRKLVKREIEGLVEIEGLAEKWYLR